MRKYALDTNCYIDASHDAVVEASMQEFIDRVAPAFHVSSVVAAELLGGARSAQERKVLEDRVLGPFVRRDRIFSPGPVAWDALGRTLAHLRESDGLQPSQVRRSFAFDILIAHSCRERGIVLVTGNVRDMERIRKVFAFDYVAPYPPVASVA